MITLARIIQAYRHAEQFELPVQDRSFLWHLLIVPQFLLSILSLYGYYVVTDSHLWGFFLLALDVALVSIPFFAGQNLFDLALDYFRIKYED